MNKTDFQIERLLLKTGNVINSIRDQDLKAYDLTAAQSETILFYADHPGSNIRELAGHLKITHQAARKLVAKLRMKEILEVQESAADKRSTCIFLSETGQLLYRKLHRKGSSNGENLLQGFSETEKTRLLGYLQRMEENCSASADIPQKTRR